MGKEKSKPKLDLESFENPSSDTPPSLPQGSDHESATLPITSQAAEQGAIPQAAQQAAQQLSPPPRSRTSSLGGAFSKVMGDAKKTVGGAAARVSLRPFSRRPSGSAAASPDGELGQAAEKKYPKIQQVLDLALDSFKTAAQGFIEINDTLRSQQFVEPLKGVLQVEVEKFNHFHAAMTVDCLNGVAGVSRSTGVPYVGDNILAAQKTVKRDVNAVVVIKQLERLKALLQLFQDHAALQSDIATHQATQEDNAIVEPRALEQLRRKIGAWHQRIQAFGGGLETILKAGNGEALDAFLKESKRQQDSVDALRTHRAGWHTAIKTQLQIAGFYEEGAGAPSLPLPSRLETAVRCIKSIASEILEEVSSAESAQGEASLEALQSRMPRDPDGLVVLSPDAEAPTVDCTHAVDVEGLQQSVASLQEKNEALMQSRVSELKGLQEAFITALFSESDDSEVVYAQAAQAFTDALRKFEAGPASGALETLLPITQLASANFSQVEKLAPCLTAVLSQCDKGSLAAKHIVLFIYQVMLPGMFKASKDQSGMFKASQDQCYRASEFSSDEPLSLPAVRQALESFDGQLAQLKDLAELCDTTYPVTQESDTTKLDEAKMQFMKSVGFFAEPGNPLYDTLANGLIGRVMKNLDDSWVNIEAKFNLAASYAEKGTLAQPVGVLFFAEKAGVITHKINCLKAIDSLELAETAFDEIQTYLNKSWGATIAGSISQEYLRGLGGAFNDALGAIFKTALSDLEEKIKALLASGKSASDLSHNLQQVLLNFRATSSKIYRAASKLPEDLKSAVEKTVSSQQVANVIQTALTQLLNEVQRKTPSADDLQEVCADVNAVVGGFFQSMPERLSQKIKRLQKDALVRWQSQIAERATATAIAAHAVSAQATGAEDTALRTSAELPMALAEKACFDRRCREWFCEDLKTSDTMQEAGINVLQLSAARLKVRIAALSSAAVNNPQSFSNRLLEVELDLNALNQAIGDWGFQQHINNFHYLIKNFNGALDTVFSTLNERLQGMLEAPSSQEVQGAHDRLTQWETIFNKIAESREKFPLSLMEVVDNSAITTALEEIQEKRNALTTLQQQREAALRATEQAQKQALNVIQDIKASISDRPTWNARRKTFCSFFGCDASARAPDHIDTLQNQIDQKLEEAGIPITTLSSAEEGSQIPLENTSDQHAKTLALLKWVTQTLQDTQPTADPGSLAMSVFTAFTSCFSARHTETQATYDRFFESAKNAHDELGRVKAASTGAPQQQFSA